MHHRPSLPTTDRVTSHAATRAPRERARWLGVSAEQVLPEHRRRRRDRSRTPPPAPDAAGVLSNRDLLPDRPLEPGAAPASSQDDFELLILGPATPLTRLHVKPPGLGTAPHLHKASSQRRALPGKAGRHRMDRTRRVGRLC